MTEMRSPPSAADRAALIRRHFLDLFSRAFPPDGAPREGCFRTVTRQPHPLGNLLCVGPGVPGSVVAEEARPLCDAAFPSAVILTGGDLAEQRGAVSPLGFEPAESMSLMSVTPETLAATTLAEGYALVETGPADNGRWCESLAVGYGIPPALAALFGPARLTPPAPATARFFAAERDGVFAAVSMVYATPEAAGVYCVATHPDHRRRGLGAHLTAEALRRVWAGGTGLGVLQSSVMGEPVYRRIGFDSHGAMALLVRVPSSG